MSYWGLIKYECLHTCLQDLHLPHLEYCLLVWTYYGSEESQIKKSNFTNKAYINSHRKLICLLRWPKKTKISDFIFSAYRKIKSETPLQISDFIFQYVKNIKSEILPKISDLIFLYIKK